MYRTLRADKDAYINDRVVRNNRVTGSNVGAAGSLDLFKLYGFTSSGSSANIELSRLLVHFDLTDLRTLVSTGKIDTSNPSFHCRFKLFDVFGGQPTPKNFTVTVHPLSRSFDEGVGRDVVFYADDDVCNFISGSRSQGAWILSGANAGGHVTGSVDYVTTAVIDGVTSSLEVTQLFVTGEEDLDVDVTRIVSATLAGTIPDSGFRVAFTSSLETDARTYFVKRFGARTAFNEDKHPKLTVSFDDSIQDDSNNLFFDASGSIFLYNYRQGNPINLLSGTTQVTGTNSLVLKMQTAISGGFYTLFFTGSQHRAGTNFVTGVYSASVFLPATDSTLAAKLAASGSVLFTPIWGSLNGAFAFNTGSAVTVYPATRGSTVIEPKKYTVTVAGLRSELEPDEETIVKVNIFDRTLPGVKLVKLPIELPGVVIRDVHYSVRNADTGLATVPFDTVHNSSRVSSDASGMYFRLDGRNLTIGQSYVVDILVMTNNNRQVHRGASPVFRVSTAR